MKTSLLAAAILALICLPALAQSDDDKTAALETRVTALEQKISALQTQIRNLSRQISGLQQQAKPAAAPAQPSAADEQAAAKLYEEIVDLSSVGKADEARARFKELSTKYGNTRTARRAQSLERELALMGSEAPTDYSITKWLQGEVSLPPDKPTLLVFWELWCPHCRREAPKMQQIYEKYGERGLQVIGMTRLSRDTTEDKVMSFLQEQKISYPNAQVEYEVNRAFDVRGIPAAALVKDGKIIWRGHPARLTDEALDKLL